jgi:hypothetical protein
VLLSVVPSVPSVKVGVGVIIVDSMADVVDDVTISEGWGRVVVVGSDVISSPPSSSPSKSSWPIFFYCYDK